MKNNFLAVGLILVMILMTGCNFAPKNKSKGNISNKTNDQKLIEQAYLDKYPNGDRNKLLLAIDSIDGNYASGLVTDPEGLGGARWLAYKNLGQWEIVWDGNGDVFCSDIDGYDFPLAMISECYDDVEQQMIDLSTGKEIGGDENLDESSMLRSAMLSYLTDGELEDMTVSQITGNYAKGSVSLIGGAGGWFLAYKEDGEWSIVAVGSDVVDCDLVEKYGFPTDMVTVCYDAKNNESKIRVTKNDIDKILAEIIGDLGYKIGAIEDTVFEWENYGGELTRVQARGTEITEIVSWEGVKDKLEANNYYFDEANNSTNLYGFFVRDNVVCQMYQYNDGGIYLSCGIIN